MTHTVTGTAKATPTTRGRKLLAGVLTLAAATGLSITAGGTAEAHYSQCAEKRFCLWEHSGYEGRFFSSAGSVSNVGDYMNDRATSYWNRTDNWISIFQNGAYGECMESVAPGGSTANIYWVYNDAATGFRIGKFC